MKLQPSTVSKSLSLKPSKVGRNRASPGDRPNLSPLTSALYLHWGPEWSNLDPVIILAPVSTPIATTKICTLIPSDGSTKFYGNDGAIRRDKRSRCFLWLFWWSQTVGLGPPPPTYCYPEACATRSWPRRCTEYTIHSRYIMQHKNLYGRS